MKQIGIISLMLFLFSCSKDSKQLLVEEPDNQEMVTPQKFIETAPPILKAVHKKINNYIGGYYQSLPSKYDERSEKYPLIIFVHGLGQVGNGKTDLSKIAEEAIIKRISQKTFPPHITVGKDAHSFVVLAPQFSSHESLAALHGFVEYAVKNYRVDLKRIYLAGLSLGGRMICDYAATYPSRISAIVPMAGVSKPDETFSSKTSSIAKNNIPVWEFHNRNDELMSSVDAELFVSEILEKNPGHQAMISLLSDKGEQNHDSWTRASDPSFKVNEKNIYQWMLQFSK
ncbi:MAG: carboxylesterase family protein [Flavitalea sp.]